MSLRFLVSNVLFFQQLPFLEASVWGWLYSDAGEGVLLFLCIFLYIPLNGCLLIIVCADGFIVSSFQSAPTASVASDIVYRHIPSATCVSEVFLSLYPSIVLLIN